MPSVAYPVLFPSFTPLRLPGLQLWLDASNGPKSGNAVGLDRASSQSLSIADNAAVSMGAGVRMTMSCWVYLASKPVEMGIVGQYNVAVGKRAYLLEYNFAADCFRFYVSGDGTATSQVDATTFGSPPTATWMFVTVYYDGTNIGISVNNGAFNTAAFSADINDSDAAFLVGALSVAGAPTLFLDGRVDALSIYKVVRSAAAITAEYNNGNGVRAYEIDNTNCVARWDMEQASGNRLDSVGANNLTANNTPLNAPGVALSNPVDGDGVRQWTDRYSGISFLQAVGVSQPIYKANIVNGRPVVRFDGVNDFMIATFARSMPFTFNAVAKIYALANDSLYYSGKAENVQFGLSNATGNQFAFGGGVLGGVTAVGLTLYRLATLIANDAASVLYMDGGLEASGNIGSPGSLTGLTLGAYQGSGQFTQIDIPEVVTTGNIMSQRDVMRLHRYWNKQYARGLPI